MPAVTLAQVSKIIFQDGQLFIPKRIEKAIQDCIENDLDLVEQAGEELIQLYKVVDKAISLDYSRGEIIDAYTFFYTRRNTLIPRIALRDLVLNPRFRLIPPQIRVLDLGSGTGAIVLGLLDMFAQPPLDAVAVQIDAVDVVPQILQRFRRLLQAAGLPISSVHTLVVDLKDTSALGKKLEPRGDYDLIFAANVFNEMEYDESTSVLRVIAQHLSDKGVIVIANAQRDYTKALLPMLVNEALQLGLFVYYPCPQGRTPGESTCWFWREHEYKYGTLKVKGKSIISSHREQLVVNWLLLCNKPYSIYDEFRNRYPNLQWGVLSIYGDDSRLCDCQVCSTEGMKNIGKQPQSYKRGSIVGGSGDPFQISRYCEL